MRNHVEIEAVQASALFAIWKLCGNRHAKPALIQIGAKTDVERAMRIHKDSDKVEYFGGLAIRGLRFWW
jgi:hypothetical protein